MFSTVKIENEVILDGKKLKCVKSYRLEQVDGDCVADLTVNMDVQVTDVTDMIIDRFGTKRKYD